MRRVFLLTILLPAGFLWAREQATLVREYPGVHPAEFTALFDRVRLLARQAQLEVSSQLGLLQYQEGFRYPITIRFEDTSANPGLGSAMAYVGLLSDGKNFRQELVVNLTPYLRTPSDFNRVFYHEMTHAVLNDAVGGVATQKVPPWVQEGLAQFISGEGEERATQAAQQYRRSKVHVLLRDLLGPYTASSYPQYYLAIKYMKDKHSINAVQALVRTLIAGAAVREAVEESVGMPWDKFAEEVRGYSLEILQDKARPDF